ncbi:hypothetical protein S7711_07507 [Stachybotrys chartarum IBT 7711]|uniref:Uncharacterized protein n=1 Tax=Stachybotrys chartarum (strain CBS 109288 / IBT 7711) TaxID=1280523 RepID=A0A084B7F5_STACB|nr:hypothetical protein S7711_07507 [Stachybotrys chartarum IBT 7711]
MKALFLDGSLKIQEDISDIQKAFALAADSYNAEEEVRLLLDQYGGEIKVTEEVLKAAAGNLGEGEDVMRLLLDKRGDEILITEEVLKAAAKNHEDGEAVMRLLLDKRGDEILITEEVLKTAAASELGAEIMDLLLENQGDKIMITEAVMRAAAGNYSGKDVMDLLLQERGDEVTITEEVLKAAATNESGKEVMDLLLQERGGEITITEEVVKAAATNESGKEVMDLLLKERGDEIIITEEVVKAAAANESGKEVMDFLLQERGGEITITEEVVKAAVTNRAGREVLDFLFKIRGDEIKITEAIVRAGTENQWGSGILDLFVEKRRDEMKQLEEVVRTAPEHVRLDEYLLSFHRQGAHAVDETNSGYDWTHRLEHIGYSVSEIAELMGEEAFDTPWIYFEPAGSVNMSPEPGQHIRGCPHHLTLPSLAGVEPRPTPMLLPENHDYDSTLQKSQELCGLAGISPNTREQREWVGSVEFLKEEKSAAISYTLSFEQSQDVARQTFISRISQALKGFCSAAGLVQSRRQCCDSFTILKASSSTSDGSGTSDALVAEMVSVDFLLALNLSTALASAEATATNTTSDQLITTSRAILDLVWPDMTVDHEESTAIEDLQLCALAVQVLCLGFLSYAQAHTGEVWPFFLDMPMHRLTLLGLEKETNSSSLVAELVELSCLAEMTRGPVLMFHNGQESAKGQTSKTQQGHHGVLKYDVVGHASDILDTWGPGNLVFPITDSNIPVGIRIGDGFIFPSENGQHHWAPSMPDISRSRIIDLQQPLLVGSLVTENDQCTLDKAQCWKASLSKLDFLGTSSDYWERSQRQVGIQVGLGDYVLGQTVETWNKKRGIPVKAMVLKATDEDFITHLNKYWGMQVSHCTGVTRRIPLRILLAELLVMDDESSAFQHVVEKLSQGSSNEELCQEFKALRTSAPAAYHLLWVKIRAICTALETTGVDPDGRHFSVAWPFGNDRTRCFKVPLEAESSWARVAADSQYCATFAYISMKCLETVQHKCSGRLNWQNQIHSLETAVTCAWHGHSGSDWKLEDGRTYFFSQLDGMLNPPSNLA